MMWVPDGVDDEGPEHCGKPRGLFPHSARLAESELARRRFRFLGRLVGKALLDGHISLPLNPAFIRVAILPDADGGGPARRVRRQVRGRRGGDGSRSGAGVRRHRSRGGVQDWVIG